MCLASSSIAEPLLTWYNLYLPLDFQEGDFFIWSKRNNFIFTIFIVYEEENKSEKMAYLSLERFESDNL